MIEPADDLIEFEISIHKWTHGIEVETRGDLDLTTVQRLDRLLTQSIEEIKGSPAAEHLILDLRKLVFIDSAGLALLIKVSKELSGINRTLQVVVARSSQPERILKIGHFDKILELTYSPSA